MRIKIIRITTIIAFIVVALDLIYVQAIRGPYYFNLSKNNRIRIVSLEGWRGRIFDAQGEVLADNRISYNVMVTPQDIVDVHKLFTFLSDVLKVDQQALVEQYLKRKYTPFTPVAVAEDVSRSMAIVIEENKYQFPSLFIQESFRRFYPQGNSSAHVLGYVGKISREESERLAEYGYTPQSIVGKSGVEKFYNTYLKGREGGFQIEVNSRGRQVRLLSLREPTKGEDIQLTINSDIQQIALEVLGEARGAIVVMDIVTGEILSMNSSPSFNPNMFMDNKYRERAERLMSQEFSPFLNRAISGQFPPGSVFKIPVALGALDSKKSTPNTTFVCEGYHEVGGTRFGCSHIHGAHNLTEAIAHSCNVYFFHLGMMLGADQMSSYAKMFGLGRLTHVDLPFEKAGFIPSRRSGLLSTNRKWYTGDTINFSIGQGDALATPMQLVRMISTVARDGVELQPHVIKSIGNKPVDRYNYENTIKIDPKALAAVKQGMRATVSDYAGTAHVLNLNNLYVAGKTGTAQSSRGKEDHAWFAGYTQGAAKDIAFVVFLEHGGSSHNACLLARQLLVKMKDENIL